MFTTWNSLLMTMEQPTHEPTLEPTHDHLSLRDHNHQANIKNKIF